MRYPSSSRADRRRSRLSAALPVLVLALAAGLGAGFAPTGTAQAAPAPTAELESPARAAATWAAAQLTDGTHASEDHGLTADLVLGLAATGTGGRTVAAAGDWLENGAEWYISRGVSGDVNAGAAAKLALVAGVDHPNREATDFGGVDLVSTLLDRLQDSGRFTDDTASGDLSNQFTQSLAVLALERTGEVPAPAVDFLAGTRCADGGYPLSLRSDPDNCTADVDSTAMAVQALLATGRTADVTPALDWLESRQGTDGGFDYAGTGATAANSNSTALAVQALTAGGRSTAADQGVDWLHGVQLGCAASADERGAVGYLEPVVDGATLRATAQVIPALAGKALGDIDNEATAPDLADIACVPPGGEPNGGTSEGGSGGSDGGTSEGVNGGTDGGGTDGGTSGGSPGDGSTGGDAANGGGQPDADTQTPVAPVDTASGIDPSGPDPTGAGGTLAASGATAGLPLSLGAAVLLALGVAALLTARARRTR